MQRAEVGYRIAKRHNGKGYATQALKLILDDAFGKYGLHAVEANTTPDNIGSQIVLIKNGFELVGRSRDYAVSRSLCSMGIPPAPEWLDLGDYRYRR
ncbi:MAG: GNAT family N-acetyltransferase [Bacillota bacterium]